MKIAIAILCLLLATAAHAGGWTPLTIGEEAAFQSINLIDWGTTADIGRDAFSHCSPNRYGLICYSNWHPFQEKESAWAIGHYPSQGSVNNFMAMGAALHLAVSWALLDHPRAEQVWQLVTLGATTSDGVRNLSMGLRMKF